MQRKLVARISTSFFFVWPENGQDAAESPYLEQAVELFGIFLEQCPRLRYAWRRCCRCLSGLPLHTVRCVSLRFSTIIIIVMVCSTLHAPY